MSAETLSRKQVRERYLALEKKGLFDQHVDSIDMDKAIPVTKDYHYYPKSLSEWLVRTARYELGVRPFMRKINNRCLETEVVGRKNLRGVKSAIVVCNHVHMFDCVAIKKAMKGHYLNVVAASFNNFKGKLGDGMRASGMLPLPASFDGMKSFEAALEKSLRKRHYVLFFPERAEWWYYHKLRPFKDGAFHYAIKYGVPIVPCYISFAPRKKPFPNFEGDYPERMIVHILSPIYPDGQADFSHERERLKGEAFEECADCYERSYGVRLSYGD
ncbi:MAG: 1-acyl-sn-glycerol-3-phosphate acyltransferase [Bacilli bacterium]|jgi:1-acyl-sn-glycerol-3-phosphate acyltransferase|nr:1-acyl-sn-glycerol-3-phosphate acyltransferase [Bacilli bacterium]